MKTSKCFNGLICVGVVVTVAGFAQPVIAEDEPTSRRGQMGASPGFGPRSQTAPEAGLETRPYALKHAPAEYIAVKIINLIDLGHTARIAVDERTNQLIVVSDAAGHERVTQVIGLLDVEASEPETGALPQREYQLDPGEVSSFSELLFHVVGNGEGLNVSSGSDGRITVQAPAAVLDEVSRLVELQNQPPDPVPSYRLRVVWLVSGKEADGFSPVPPDLREVADALANMGITDLRTASQVMVQNTGSKEFYVQGQPNFSDTPVRLSVVGQFIDSTPGSTESLRLELSIEGPGQNGGTESWARIVTDLNLPPGHPVVLGTSPTREITSVFIVIVDDIVTNGPNAGPLDDPKAKEVLAFAEPLLKERFPDAFERHRPYVAEHVPGTTVWRVKPASGIQPGVPTIEVRQIEGDDGVELRIQQIRLAQ